jgi:RNA polymerase sigma factor (sigma-70 family)
LKAADLQLVLEGCLRKDPRQQRILYECFARPMLGICMRYAADRMEAEDVLQTGFVKIFKAIDSFKGGSFEGWMKRIFVHESINQYHNRKRKPLDYFEEFPRDVHFADGFTDAISLLGVEDIMKLVNKLPEGSRLVFNLFAIEGYGHSDIAEMLGISEGTSKSQYSRARMLLRNQLTLEKTN